jgi:PPP family 3-phenylpropionic acid transporter
LYGSVAYGAGGLGGALLAGALWESTGAAITFSAASLLALIGLILVWRGVPADSARPAVR